jgi:hypothetical protein
MDHIITVLKALEDGVCSRREAIEWFICRTPLNQVEISVIIGCTQQLVSHYARKLRLVFAQHVADANELIGRGVRRNSIDA